MQPKSFYNETVSQSEFEAQVAEEDNPFVEDYNLADVNRGLVKRKDLLGPIFFEGFTSPDEDGVRYIKFGT